MSEKEKHLIEYTAFAGACIALLGLLWEFRENNEVLRIVIGFGCALYVLWGIIHHHRENRISKEIIMEYAFFAGFVFLLLLTALSFT